MTRALRALQELAISQAGYFTTVQAAERGVSRRVLSHHARGGHLVRVRRGVYRLSAHPPSVLEHVLVACLWAGHPSRTVAASHDTALVVHGIVATPPASVHVTVTHRFAGRDPGVVVHRGALDADDLTVRDDVVVTTMVRTIADLAGVTGPTVLQPVIELALEHGALTVEQLRRMVLASPAVAEAATGVLFRINGRRSGTRPAPPFTRT